jgi:multicomponent K+:H+ antiporter subunit G
MLFFSVAQSRPVVHEVLIAIFVTVTTPVTLMLLVRAALSRDIQEGTFDVSTMRRGDGGAEPEEGMQPR